jgi:hypothetical protein
VRCVGRMQAMGRLPDGLAASSLLPFSSMQCHAAKRVRC